MRRLQLATVYLGGFIGPFAGQSVAVILPNVARTFSITIEQAALTVSAYLFPFATVMLFSTRIVQNLRPRRVIMTAYTVTFLGSLVCLLSTSWALFLVGFTTMGLANAFTLPVFQIMLREIVPARHLGEALGTYAAMQSFGLFSSPLISGLATLVGWQYLYLIVTAAALWVLIIKVPDIPPPGATESAGTGRRLWWPVILHCCACLMMGIGVIGMAPLTALSVGERFDASAVGRGAVIMCGGLTAFFLARPLGALVDRAGPKTILLACATASAVAMALLPIVPHPALVAAGWAVAVFATQGMQTCINLSMLRTPGGASLLSTVQAFRFYGPSITPVLLMPVYLSSANWAFWIPALMMVSAFALELKNPAWKKN